MASHKTQISNIAAQSVATCINTFNFGLLMIVLLFTSACNNLATATLSGTELPSPNVNLPNEGIQLQTPFVLDNIRFEHISVEDGLSQNGGLAILQDSDGFMWFGTQDGLNKYDGQNFTVYKHDPDNPNSLSDNYILTIYEDHLGALWIGTLAGGLDRYDRELEQFSHYQHDSDNPQNLSNNEVLAIYEDSDGALWIGTRGGLDRFDRETEIFTHYQHNPDDPLSLSTDAVLSIYESQDGILWVGTEGGGLSRIESETETFTHFTNNPDDPQSLSHNNVWAIYEDPFGMMWIGTDGGLDRFDREDRTFSHYQNNLDDPQSLAHNSVRAIYEDPSGALWIGTNGGGLCRFNRETETFTHYQNDPSDPRSLGGFAVNAIYQDREGVIWIGTNSGGLNILFLGGLNFAYFNHNPNDANSISNNDIHGIYEDQSGMLWVATSGGLNRLDQKTMQWNLYQHDPDDPFSLSSNVIGDIYEDQEGLLWIGTYDNGLNSFDPETERFTRYQDDPNDLASFKGSTVTEIYQDQQGILWIGSLEGGLSRYDQEKGSFTHYQTNSNDPDSINSDSVLSIYEDQQGWLWIGTYGDGLIKYDRENEKFTHFQNNPNDSSSLSNNLVLVIFEDRAGTLWIGTAGGLNKFDPQTETFIQYREKDGLPNDLIYGILEDEGGNLWLSTNHGLSRFESQTETFKNFDVKDGLQSNEFSSFAYHKSNTGEMFFGGVNGLNAFYPDRIQENNPYIPPISLTRLTQNGEDIALDQTINRLSEVTFYWPDNYFEFEYAALSFAQPENNRYAYMLEGFDENWNEIDTRNYGKYTNLPGGTYTLRLKGSNNDGVWNETGYSLEITIVPPLWEAWWLRAIVILVLLGGTYGGYRLRVRNLEARTRELGIQVEQRTSELLQIQEAMRQSELGKAITEERSRLARELHDSVTQSLYSLTLFTEAARHMAEEIGEESIEQNIGKIGVIGQHALKEMRLLVYELRPHELEEDGLVPALRKRLEAVEGRVGVDARVVVEDEFGKMSGEIEQEFFRIAQEALNNTLKHAAATSVIVHLRRSKGSTEIDIIDDGIGFDPDSLPDRGGVGLKSIQERANSLGGSVTIHSAPGEGTRVKVIVKDT